MSTIADLLIKVSADTARAAKDLHDVGKKGSSSMDKLGKMSKKLAIGLGTTAGVGLAWAAKTGFDEFNQGQKVAAQTASVLKSTGGAANVTAAQVSNMATALMKKSGVDDEAIASGENLLLTFTNIRNEAGKGNDIFNQATSTVLDMSVALGQDTKSSAIQLGKALNDPIKGVTALQRVGVSFTAQQKEQIATLVKHGQTLQAQKLILGELTKEFGGSAAAAGKTFAGQINIAQETLNNWLGEMVGKSIPIIQRAIGWLRDHWPEIKVAIAAFVASVKPTFVAFVLLVRDAVDNVRRHWDTIGPIVMGVVTIIRNAINQIAAILRLISAILRGDWGEAWKQLKQIVVNAFAQAKAIIAQEIRVIGALLRGLGTIVRAAVSAAFNGLGALVMAGLNAIHSAIRQTAGAAYGWAKEIGSQIIWGVVNGIKSGASSVTSAITGMAKGALDKAKGILGIHSPSTEFMKVGKAIGDGIAAGIKQSEMAVINSLKGVLARAIASKDFSDVSSIIQQMFAAKQQAVRTPAEAQIASIQRAQNVDDLKQSISDAKAAVAQSAAALADAQASGDAAAVAQAQAQLASDQRAKARAEQDMKLFFLQEKAARERAALDARQSAAQIKLGMRLTQLNGLFEKHGVTIGQLIQAVHRILHNLGIRGFATGVRNFGGGLAVVGERGPELVNLPGGSDVYTNAQSRGMLDGGGGGDIVLVLDGDVLARFTRRELTRLGKRNVGLSFGTA